MENVTFENRTKKFITPIIAFCLVYFFLAFGDSLISYASPVIIENHLKNTLLVGFVLASSSVFGLFFDFFSTRIWPNAKYKYFLKLTFITTMAMPILLLIFPRGIPVFIIGMGLWGAYYEFRGFASYGFIQKHVSVDKHTVSWATLNAFSAVAYLVGPLLATFIIDINENALLYTALVTFILAWIIYALARPMLGDRQSPTVEESKHGRSTLEQLKVIFTLFKSVWHLFIYTFALYMIDSAFWTIGILYTEKLKDSDKLGNLFIVAYMIPSLFTAYIAPKIPKEWSKKRASFIAGLVCGIILICMGALTKTPAVLITVLLMSIFYDISLVLNLSVFEDYIARLGKFGNDMAGINQSAISLAYIIGPILWGWVAEIVGYQKAFSLSGVLLASVCVACFIAVPRKVKMPQTDLQNI